MIHFSCDGCGESLPEDRYQVRVEAFPAFRLSDQLDEEPDHLEVLAEELEDTSGHSPSIDETHDLQFDLCPQCYGRFLQDPLGLRAGRKVRFSQN